jgi:hypothetical protein
MAAASQLKGAALGAWLFMAITGGASEIQEA